MSKPKLSDELRQAIDSAGLSVAEAARRADVPYESLKTWLRRNGFPRRDLPAIVRVAGLNPDLNKLEREYEFKWARGMKSARTELLTDEDAIDGVSVYASNALIDSRLPKIKRLVQNIAEDVESQFSALAGGDLFVHCSFDVPPVETKPLHMKKLGGLIAEGVSKGARFVYLIPTAAALSATSNPGLHPLLPTAENVRSCFDELEAFVRNQVQDSELVDECLRFISWDKSPFFIPGHRYSIFRYQHQFRRKSDSRCFGCFPVGVQHGLIELHLSMHDDFSNMFWAFCEKVLDQQSWKHPL